MSKCITIGEFMVYVNPGGFFVVIRRVNGGSHVGTELHIPVRELYEYLKSEIEGGRGD